MRLCACVSVCASVSVCARLCAIVCKRRHHYYISFEFCSASSTAVPLIIIFILFDTHSDNCTESKYTGGTFPRHISANRHQIYFSGFPLLLATKSN